MKYCPQCGCNVEGMNFCPDCGESLAKYQEVERSAEQRDSVRQGEPNGGMPPEALAVDAVASPAVSEEANEHQTEEAKESDSASCEEGLPSQEMPNQPDAASGLANQDERQAQVAEVVSMSDSGDDRHFEGPSQGAVSPDDQAALLGQDGEKPKKLRTIAIAAIVLVILLVLFAAGASSCGGKPERSSTSAQVVTASKTTITSSSAQSVQRVDKSEMAALLNEADDIDTAIYTDESLAAFQNALVSCKKLHTDSNAAQEDVDEATDALRSAMDGLVVDPEKQAAKEAEEAAAEQARQEEEAARKAEEERQAAEREAARQRQEEINNATVSQKNALNKAKQYLNYTAFSYSGLIGQLEYEQFSTEDATWAVDRCGADWNAQAAKKAQQYLDFTSFSRQGLIDQLLFEGFTQEQAVYGVDSVGL